MRQKGIVCLPQDPLRGNPIGDVTDVELDIAGIHAMPEPFHNLLRMFGIRLLDV
jgi:hypothetical protein